MEEYYFKQLEKQQQAAYYAIKAGLQSLATGFSVPLLEQKELSDLFMQVRLDNPQIFYAETFRYRYFSDSRNAEMIPVYLFEKGKIKEQQKAMQARVEKIARAATGKTEWETVQYVHDFLCSNVRYDKLKKQYSHEIIGPLGHGVGVCEGIAKAVKVLCDALGIWCIIALSEANPQKGIKYRHAWNVVRIGKQYYHLDCTFDISLSHAEEIRYDYFLLNDTQLFRDHTCLVWKLPACENGDLFYYKTKKLSFTKMEEVRKRTAQAVKKGKIFLFHWRGGYMTREIVQEFLQIFEEEATKKEMHAKVSLNWAQAVVRVQFLKEVPAEQVVWEDANEGEKEN